MIPAVPNWWLALSRSERNCADSRAASTALTSAFLDIDHRQGLAQAAVQAALALDPTSTIGAQWEPVQQACYQAAAAYLHATGDPDAATGPRPDLTAVQQTLDEARRGVDGFYDRHRARLEAALAATAVAESRAAKVLQEAGDALRRLADTNRQCAAYPSVQSARDRVEGGCHELQLARTRADHIGIYTATTRLDAAVSALLDALTQAPHRSEQARTTLVAVRTRLDAARTRAHAIRPNLSTLLREFHADSSKDLTANELQGRAHLDRAEALLQQARTASSEQRAEAVLDLATQARAEIGVADELIDAVTERLMALRDIRTAPRRREQQVRFELRDAQYLAVSRGAVGDWGTALDAQVDRINRIVAALDARLPDYWQYHLALQDVSDFIADIVNRIRQPMSR